MAELIASGLTVVDSSDLDHYRAQPGNWNVQVNQIGKGVFRSHVRCIELPGLKVYDNHWDAACQAIGQSPNDWFMLGSMATFDGPGALWSGRRLDQRVFACTSPGSEVQFNTEQRAHTLVVLVQQRLLEKTCGAEAVEFIRQHPNLCFDPLVGSALVELVLDLLQRCETLPQLLQQPAIAARIRSNLLRALEECFAGLFQQDVGARSIREEAFHAAVLHANQAIQKTSAWHMSQAAGVSQKTLEVAFRECMGITPGRYLALARLNGAHHQLAHGRANELFVTKVSTDWGFSHPGRFACAYRQLFGELPSQTLRRPAPLD